MFFLQKSSNNMESSEDGEGDLNIDYAVRMKNNIEKYYGNQDGEEELKVRDLKMAGQV